AKSSSLSLRSSHRAGGSGSDRGPLVVLTGASGFLGRPLARQLAARGFRVRGVGRGANPSEPSIHEWVREDLSRGVRPETFAGAHAVVHAAAATSGGFAVHQRHSIDAAQNVVDSMAAAGVTRLVHISSLSVVEPPTSLRDVQDEKTARADDPRDLGPYTWGKSRSEQVVEDRCAAAEIAVRIIRPGALTDRLAPELPGLVGRRLFGPWHLCLGRPSLPIAVCDVELAAAAITWCVEHFDSAPHVVNLIDPDVDTRASLIARMREDGWRGRGLWVPISFLACAMTCARWAIGTIRGQRADRMAVWQILRPRRFDTSLSAQLIDQTRKSESMPPRLARENAAPEPADFAASGDTAA
ncbi:MAG TPA: NAD(P)-dependent oxidoreductase, partial [Gemmatimonadaceae bacterium]